MKSSGVGVRAKKAAKMKVNILNAAMQLIGKKSFAELYVDEICEKVKISKVTFFKYFPQKDDILIYFLRVWCLDRAVELHKDKKQGLEGVTYLFDKVADSYERNPGIMLSLVSYLTNMTRPPAPIPLKPLEKQIIHPEESDVNKIEIRSIPQMLENFALEAIFNRQITGINHAKDLSNLLVTALYGSIITVHLEQINPAKILFRRNVDNLLRGITTPS